MSNVVSWIESEPVLTRVGPAVLLIVGFLVARGVIDRDTYDMVLGVVGLILGGGGLAGARAAVTPTAKLGGTEPGAGRHGTE